VLCNETLEKPVSNKKMNVLALLGKKR